MFGNLSKARQAIEGSQTSNRPRKTPSFMHELWTLIPGESVIVRFVGGEGEPYIFNQHGFSRHPDRGFEKGICAKPEACSLCQAASAIGEKRVKKASPYAAFSVYSPRKMMKVPFTRDDGSSGFKRSPVRCDIEGCHIYKNTNGQTVSFEGGVDPKSSQYELEDEGVKVWCGSLHPKASNADQIIGLDMQLQKLCKCRNTVGAGLSSRPAETTTAGYECKSCGESSAYNPNVGGQVTCQECGYVGVPQEVVDCTANCDNPTRGGLTQCYVRITRRGAGTDTTYDFTPLPFSEPEHELGTKALKDIYASDPESSLEMLRARGINLEGTGGNLWSDSTSSDNIPFN